MSESQPTRYTNLHTQGNHASRHSSMLPGSNSPTTSTASSRDRSKVDDPLSEPIVQATLKRIAISGSQLINMSVKELNKKLSHCPAVLVTKLKRCRRTLKNRGYAKNCRIKRTAARNRLEQINDRLVSENLDLREQVKMLSERLKHGPALKFEQGTAKNMIEPIGFHQCVGHVPINEYSYKREGNFVGPPEYDQVQESGDYNQAANEMYNVLCSHYNYSDNIKPGECAQQQQQSDWQSTIHIPTQLY